MKTVIFERENGSQVLVTLFAPRGASMAERDHSDASWSQPIWSEIADPFEPARTIQELLISAGYKDAL